MRIIDFFIDAVRNGIKTPEHEKEILYFFLMDLALKSKQVSERKAWEFLALLVSIIWKERKIPSLDAVNDLIKIIKAKFRQSSPPLNGEGNINTRTSKYLYTLDDFELGERALRRFLSERAWKGMPGFEEDGTPLK